MPDVKKDRGLFVRITSIRVLDVAVTLVGSLIKLVKLYSFTDVKLHLVAYTCTETDRKSVV